MSSTSKYDLKSEREGWLALIGPQPPHHVRVLLIKDFEQWEEAVAVANGVMGR